MCNCVCVCRNVKGHRTDFCITHKRMNQSEFFIFSLEIEMKSCDWLISLCAETCAYTFNSYPCLLSSRNRATAHETLSFRAKSYQKQEKSTRCPARFYGPYTMIGMLISYAYLYTHSLLKK